MSNSGPNFDGWAGEGGSSEDNDGAQTTLVILATHVESQVFCLA